MRIVTQLVLLLGFPILYLPLIWSTSGKEGKCGYCVAIMASFWCLELLPVSVTSLIPLIMYPLFDILPAKEVSSTYIGDVSILVMGGLMFALAMERTMLHKRIALATLNSIGTNVRRLLLGFMIVACFLSMWLMNTATMALMMTIAKAIIDQLREKSESSKFEMEEEVEDSSKAIRSLEKCLAIGLGFACNVGGTCTPTGTGPNGVFITILESNFGNKTGLNFSTFFIYAAPGALICLIYLWLLLLVMYFPPWNNLISPQQSRIISGVIRQEYKKLQSFTFKESAVLVLFILLIILWFTRDPGFMPGYSSFFANTKSITDASIVILIVIILFWIPNVDKFTLEGEQGKVDTILNWSIVSQKLQWGLLLIIGGGLAMVAGIKESKLDVLIISKLSDIDVLPRPIMIFAMITVVGFLTEFISNTATAILVEGLLAPLSLKLHVNPLFLMFPTVIACSFAFCMPIATPSNAIAFSQGNLKIKHMMKTGIFANLGCFLVAAIMANTWGNVVFNMDEFPSWASDKLLNFTEFP